jgi:hypothetical protein
VIAAEEEFDELCFQYGIELDDVAPHSPPLLANQGGGVYQACWACVNSSPSTHRPARVNRSQ